MPTPIDPYQLPADEIPPALHLDHYLYHPVAFRHTAVLEGRFAWDPLNALGAYLERLQPPALPTRGEALRTAGARSRRAGEITGEVILEEGVDIEPHVVLRAVQGRLYLGRNARIGAFSRVEVIGGDLYLHEGARLQAGCRVTGWGSVGAGATLADSTLRGKIILGEETTVERATVIGPCCVGAHVHLLPGAFVRENSLFGDHVVFRSESKNAIIMDGFRDEEYLASAAHYTYVGDSILAPGVNLGAGTITSNLKVDRSMVSVTVDGARYLTRRVKLGAVVGQLSQLGCHTVLDPGALIGPQVLSYPGATLRGYYPPRAIVKVRQIQEVVERH